MIRIGLNVGDEGTSLSDQLDSEQNLLASLNKEIKNSPAFSSAHQMVHDAISAGARMADSHIRDRYSLTDENEYFSGEAFSSDNSYELIHDILLSAMEYLAERGESQFCKDLLYSCTDFYQIAWGDLSYYAREYDPNSQNQMEGLSNQSTEKRAFSQKLIHCYVESYLISGDGFMFMKKLVEHRLDLSPTMLIQSVLRLIYGFNLQPDPNLFSVIFGGRIESNLNPSRATKIGEISLDNRMRQFLSENNLPFSTHGLIKYLDSFFDHYSGNNPNWFKMAYEKAFSRRTIKSKSKKCLTAGIFNYSGWADGKQSAQFHWDKNVRYPDDSLENTRYYISKETNLNKRIRNFTREYLGLPKVGEGQWLGELSLLNLLRKECDATVVHQWSPDWLSPQRIDVGIPELNLGFEFNGLQHYEPVDFFGGERAFNKQKKLDKKKKLLCDENGVTLIEIRYDAETNQIQEIVKNILAEHSIG